jgi:hypothetical protein
LFPFTSYFSAEGFFVDPPKKLHMIDEGYTVKSALEYGLDYFFSSFCKNAVSKSMGRGRIMVEFFSDETFARV